MSLLDPILSTGGPAVELDTTGDPVNVGAAAPPNAGDVLTALDERHAAWAPPTGGGGVEIGTGPGQAAPGDNVLLRGPNDWDAIEPLDGSPAPGDVFLIERASDGAKATVTASRLIGRPAESLNTLSGDPVNVGASPQPSGAGFALVSLDSARATWQQLSPKYAVENYAPDRVLTTANFEAALNAAIAAAIAATVGTNLGVTVVMPSGRWPMTAPLVIKPSTIGQAIALVGQGRSETVLYWPAAYALECVDIQCNIIPPIPPDDIPGAEYFGKMLMRDFDITGGGITSGCIGLRMRGGAAAPVVERIGCATHGVALKLHNTYRTNNPWPTFINCAFGISNIGVEIQGALAGRFIACDIFGNVTNDVVFGSGNSVAFTDCSLHSDSPTLDSLVMSADNAGGNDIHFTGQTYHEGTIRTFFKWKAPGSTHITDSFYFDGVGFGGCDTVFDIDCTIGQVAVCTANTRDWGINRYLIGTKAVHVQLDNILSPDESAAKYTIDEYTRAALVIPRTLRNAFYTKRSTEARELTEALRPFSREIFDFSRPDSVTLTGSTVDQIRGLVGGSIATSATPAQKYEYVQDGKFGGNPYIRGTRAANSNAHGTLAGVATDWTGIFVVAYVPSIAPTGDTFGPSVYNNAGSYPFMRLRFPDITGPDSVAAIYYPNTISTPFLGTGYTSPFTLGHTFAMCGCSYLDLNHMSQNGIQFQLLGAMLNEQAQTGIGSTVAPGLLYPAAALFNRFSIGHIDPAVGGDVSIAYVAYLRRAPTRQALGQIMGMARARFRLGLKDLI